MTKKMRKKSPRETTQALLTINGANKLTASDWKSVVEWLEGMAKWIQDTSGSMSHTFRSRLYRPR